MICAHNILASPRYSYPRYQRQDVFLFFRSFHIADCIHLLYSLEYLVVLWFEGFPSFLRKYLYRSPLSLHLHRRQKPTIPCALNFRKIPSRSTNQAGLRVLYREMRAASICPCSRPVQSIQTHHNIEIYISIGSKHTLNTFLGGGEESLLWTQIPNPSHSLLIAKCGVL